MQTTKQPTGLRTASDYKTLVQQAINKVTGFAAKKKQCIACCSLTEEDHHKDALNSLLTCYMPSFKNVAKSGKAALCNKE